MKKLSNTTSFYDKRWKDSGVCPEFLSYERNGMLSDFFGISKKQNLLDVCCGIGDVSKYFTHLGYRVWGIDISTSAIREARKNSQGNFLVGNIEKGLPYTSHKFDVIFWGDGIEHVFSPMQVLLELKRVLKRTGRIVISTPNTSFWLYRWHYLKTGMLPITEGHQSEVWDTGHIRFFNVLSLTQLLKKVGFKITQVKGASKGGIHSYLSKFYPSLCAPILIIEAKRL